MNQFQQRIKRFIEDRDWGQFHSPKDLLLGIVEEVGEIRNIVKWEQDADRLQTALDENRDEMEDNIGDIYWFLALLANSCTVNIDGAIDKVIKKNEVRFPVPEVKSNHANRHMGGNDNQYTR